MHILCVNALKLLSGFFWLFLGQGLAFLVKTGWQPYCEVVRYLRIKCTKYIKFLVCSWNNVQLR